MGLRSLFAVGALIASVLLAPTGAPAPTQLDLAIDQPQPLQDDEIPAGVGLPVAWGNPGTYVPVLMYHYIRVNPNPRDRVGASLSVTPAAFHAQMDYLARNHFHVIRLTDAVAAIRQHRPLPSRPVVLTFDDGYADFFTTAVPELQRYGFTATDYVVPGFLGQPRYMTWDQVKHADAMGFTIGAHTMHHRALAGMSRAAALVEMSQSKRVLENALGHPIVEFAYPYGSFNGYLARQARAMGFESATSTIRGSWHQPGSLWFLTRLRVGGSTSLAAYARLVGGPAPN